MKVASPEATRFAEHLTRIVARHWTYDYAAPTFEVDPGIKYDRIVRVEGGGTGQRSAHAFVDAEGRVYKAESWRKPSASPRYEDIYPAMRAFKNSESDRRIGNTGYLYASYKPAVKDN